MRCIEKKKKQHVRIFAYASRKKVKELINLIRHRTNQHISRLDIDKTSRKNNPQIETPK